MASKYTQMSDKQLEAFEMKRCPINRAHVMKISRFQRHISECLQRLDTIERNKWKICPFNACHVVAVEDYEKHLISCYDNRSFVRSVFDQFSDSSEENKLLADIEIKDEKMSETEAKEQMAKQSKAEPSANGNDWDNAGGEEYTIYQKPGASSAKDFIDDHMYWYQNNGSIDSISYSALKRPQRKQLLQMMCDKVKEKASAPPVQKRHHSRPHFHPILQRVEEIDENSSVMAVTNPLINWRKAMMSQTIKTTALEAALLMPPLVPSVVSTVNYNKDEPIIKAPGNQCSLFEPLHSVQLDPNYFDLMAMEKNRQNEGTDVALSLRGIDLYPDYKLIGKVADRPLRLPTSNPFEGQLRKPKPFCGGDSGAEGVPKHDINNN